jgi:hypothetical protein
MLGFGLVLMKNIHRCLEAIAADHRIQAADNKFVAGNFPTAETARSVCILFFCHIRFIRENRHLDISGSRFSLFQDIEITDYLRWSRPSTWSIMPYSLASAAVIQ